jgi:hypothetical protein
MIHSARDQPVSFTYLAIHHFPLVDVRIDDYAKP